MAVIMASSIIDTHTHLCDSVFDQDRDAVLERARVAGVIAAVVVGETLTDARANLELARRYPMLLPAAGLYPEHLDLDQAAELAAFIRENHRQLAAVGEVGLDHWKVKNDSDRNVQEEIFRGFVQLAMELDLPLNVHSRSAGKKTIAVLLESGAQSVQMHAFDGKAGSALPAVEAGYYFSISPSVVRSRQKQKLVKALPLSCLLLETDSPVLGPEPGIRNEPANIVVAVDAIAEIKNAPREAVLEATAANTRALYGAAVANVPKNV